MLVLVPHLSRGQEQRAADEHQQRADSRPFPTGSFEADPRATVNQARATQEPHEWPDGRFLHWLTGWLGTSSPTDWLLVIVGIGGVIAALRTLAHIETQAGAAKDAANAAERSAIAAERALVVSNRAYLDVTKWELLKVLPSDTQPEYFMIRMEICTASPTPARIEALTLTSQESRSQPFSQAVVSESAPLGNNITLGPLTAEQRQRFNSPGGNVSVTIAGSVRYTDVFNKTRCRRFARIFTYYGPSNLVNHRWGYPEDPTLNAEEGWGED